MIKCSLTEFGGASAENIWLGVMKKRPRYVRSVAGMIPSQVFFPSGPTTRSTSAQYFGFICHTFITHDAIEHENEKCCSFFNRKCQALVFTPLKGLIFTIRSITVQPKFLFFNDKLSWRDNRLIVFVNFSFPNGCNLHDWRHNYQKNQMTVFRFGTSHFYN